MTTTFETDLRFRWSCPHPNAIRRSGEMNSWECPDCGGRYLGSASEQNRRPDPESEHWSGAARMGPLAELFAAAVKVIEHAQPADGADAREWHRNLFAFEDVRDALQVEIET